jgi:transposase-like protein
MTTERLAVRIDPEQKKKLVEMAGRGGISVSDVVRQFSMKRMKWICESGGISWLERWQRSMLRMSPTLTN